MSARAFGDIFTQKISAMLLVDNVSTLRVGFACASNLNDPEKFIILALIEGQGPSFKACGFLLPGGLCFM